MIDDGFGHWLAGFIDGEGCFSVGHTSDGGWTATFRINLRSDDGPILHEIVERTSVGRVYAWDTARRSVSWCVASRDHANGLVAILDKYPLRAKKRRDYALWREAVLLWNLVLPGGRGTRDRNLRIWTEMEAMRDEIRSVRQWAA